MNLKFALVAYAIKGWIQTGVTIVEIKKIYIYEFVVTSLASLNPQAWHKESKWESNIEWTIFCTWNFEVIVSCDI